MDKALEIPLRKFVEAYATQNTENAVELLHEYICHKAQMMVLGEALINPHSTPQKPVPNDEDDEDEDDEKDDEDDDYCPSCAGTGEGEYDGASCRSCKGSGFRK